MKQVWISEEVFETIKKASKDTTRPMSNIVDLVLTKEINLIKNPKKLNELFSMFKKDGE